MIAGHRGEELLSDLAGLEIVFSRQAPPRLPLLPRAVIAQQPSIEIEVVREALVRQLIQAEVELGIEVIGVLLAATLDELSQIALDLPVIQLLQQLAGE